MFTRAIEWGYVAQNPAEHVKPLQENNERETFLTHEQIASLFTALEKAPRNAANCIRFILLTGQRAGNCMSARWNEFEGDLWTIPVTKSGKKHRVYLSEAALAVLQDQRATSCNGYVFPGHGTQPHLVSLQNVWVKVRKEAGIPESVRIHDLRHTYASLLINAGATLYDVQKRLGHSDSKTTQRYAHLAENRQRQIAEAATKGMVIDLGTYRKTKEA